MSNDKSIMSIMIIAIMIIIFKNIISNSKY